MKKVKALHVTGFWSGNFYYRGFLPAIANGYEAEPEFIDGESRNNGQRLVQKIDRNDVVMFQRPNNSHIVELMALTKQKGKIVIFDDDDTFKVGDGIVPQNDEEREMADKVTKNRTKALRICDGAICTTEFLAQELREIQPNTVVIPNCIDPDDEGESDENTTGMPRVLVLGSVVSNDDWHIARKAIESVKDRVTFVLMGVPEKGKYGTYDKDMEFWDTLPHIEKHGFTVFGDYYNTIQALAVDVAIAPRADNYFNRCKSNLKFLEVSLFAIPFIGQSFSDGMSPYQVNKDDADNLILAETEDDWVRELENIANNKDCYKEIGKKAKEYVLREYDINKHAHKYEDFYQSLLN